MYCFGYFLFQEIARLLQDQERRVSELLELFVAFKFRVRLA